MKKSSKNGIIVLALLIIALLFSHSLLSIWGVPAFPVFSTVTQAPLTCPAQGAYLLEGESIGNGAYIYNITYAEPVDSSCHPISQIPGYGVSELVSFNVYLPESFSNSTQVNYAIQQNNAELNQTATERNPYLQPITVCSGTTYSTCHSANPTFYQLVSNSSILNNLISVYYSAPSTLDQEIVADSEAYVYDEINQAKILVLANQYITSHIIKPTTTTNTTTTTSNTLTSTSNSTKTITPSTQSPTIAQPPSASNVFSNFFNSIINAIMNFLKTYFGI